MKAFIERVYLYNKEWKIQKLRDIWSRCWKVETHKRIITKIIERGRINIRNLIKRFKRKLTESAFRRNLQSETKRIKIKIGKIT